MVNVLTVDGMDIHASGILNNACTVAVSTIACKRQRDAVLQGMLWGVGEWSDDALQTIVFDPVYQIGTHEDECGCAACKKGRTVTLQTNSCTYKMPAMGCIQIDLPAFDVRDLVPRVCRILNIPQKGLCLFDENGNMNDVGMPSDPNVRFWNYIKKNLQAGLAELRLQFTMNGDIANNTETDAQGNVIIEEVNGIYTQALNGWEVAGDGEDCAPQYNVANVIDWESLTGGDCSYDAETGGEDGTEGTLTLWGDDYTIPAGMDFSTFLMDLIFPAVSSYEHVVLWGLHVPKGAGYCFRRNVLCLTACSCDDCRIIQQDADLQEYFSRDYNGQLFTLPDGTPIVIKETAHVADGAWLVPEIVEVMSESGEMMRCRTYGGWAENVTKYDMFGPSQDREYGESDLQSILDALSPDSDRAIMSQLLESQTTMWETAKIKPFCYTLAVTQTYGALAQYRHIWFRFDNLCCASPVKNCPVLIDGEGNPIDRSRDGQKSRLAAEKAAAEKAAAEKAA